MKVHEIISLDKGDLADLKSGKRKLLVINWVEITLVYEGKVAVNQEVTESPKYVCQKCGKTFTNHWGLNGHTARTHRVLNYAKK